LGPSNKPPFFLFGQVDTNKEEFGCLKELSWRICPWPAAFFAFLFLRNFPVDPRDESSRAVPAVFFLSKRLKGVLGPKPRSALQEMLKHHCEFPVSRFLRHPKPGLQAVRFDVSWDKKAASVALGEGCWNSPLIRKIHTQTTPTNTPPQPLHPNF